MADFLSGVQVGANMVNSASDRALRMTDQSLRMQELKSKQALQQLEERYQAAQLSQLTENIAAFKQKQAQTIAKEADWKMLITGLQTDEAIAKEAFPDMFDTPEKEAKWRMVNWTRTLPKALEINPDAAMKVTDAIATQHKMFDRGASDTLPAVDRTAANVSRLTREIEDAPDERTRRFKQIELDKLNQLTQTQGAAGSAATRTAAQGTELRRRIAGTTDRAEKALLQTELDKLEASTMGPKERGKLQLKLNLMRDIEKEIRDKMSESAQSEKQIEAKRVSLESLRRQRATLQSEIDSFGESESAAEPAPSPANPKAFIKGTRATQKGVLYEFDGTSWKPVR